MKTFTRLFTALTLVSGISALTHASDNVDPSEVKIKVYETRISPNANCSGGFIRVFQSASPTAQDFLTNPVIATGAIPNGTYRCVAMRFSDFITYKPSVTTDSGNCHAGVQGTQDIARGEVSQGPDGDSVTTAVGEDIVWVYLSTSGNDANTCFTPTQPCLLNAPLTVSSDRTGTFVVDFSNQVQDHGASCSLEGPTFSFR